MLGGLKQRAKKLIANSGYEVRRKRSDIPLSVYERLYPEESLRERRFYNIGAGSFHHQYWTNVDHPSAWYASRLEDNLHIDWDLLELTPLPVPDGVAEAVYTSHTIEHITNAAAQNMFDEAYRILKPGGYFRLTTPDIAHELAAYRRGDRDLFYWIEDYSHPAAMKALGYTRRMTDASLGQVFLEHVATSTSELHGDGAPTRISDAELDRILSEMSDEEALDYCISKAPIEVQKKYPNNHINWWTEAKARRMLEAAGFAPDSIRRSGYGQSWCPVMRDTQRFDSTHPKISLYVEAQK